jgi:hypothetical protein
VRRVPAAQQSIPLAGLRTSHKVAVPLAVACLLAVTACNLAMRTNQPVQKVTPQPSLILTLSTSIKAPDVPTPSPYIEAGSPITRATVESDIESYGVSVAADKALSANQYEAILSAVHRLAVRAADLYREKEEGSVEPYHAFKDLFGPTVIHIYQGRTTVDGVHLGINCGWQGRFAEGCRSADLFPEQNFPNGAWLILFAGEPLGSDPTEQGAGLIAHEVVHNLTWGGGSRPSNVGGFSYVHYVGDEFAIKYMDSLGIQAGRASYVDEQARKSNPLWRAEMTADAVASWALDRIEGPDAPVIRRYIHDMMVCRIFGGDLCY